MKTQTQTRRLADFISAFYTILGLFSKREIQHASWRLTGTRTRASLPMKSHLSRLKSFRKNEISIKNIMPKRAAITVIREASEKLFRKLLCIPIKVKISICGQAAPAA